MMMMMLFNYCKSMDMVHINCSGLVLRLLRMMNDEDYARSSITKQLSSVTYSSAAPAACSLWVPPPVPLWTNAL